MKNRYSQENTLLDEKYQTLKTNNFKKNKTVDINILLNRIRENQSKAYFNTLKKIAFWSSLVCIIGLLSII
tara:strand:+ start:603 stop:815 length:213 start_codon:yes stop_codon:yes gene_type:complete